MKEPHMPHTLVGNTFLLFPYMFDHLHTTPDSTVTPQALAEARTHQSSIAKSMN